MHFVLKSRAQITLIITFCVAQKIPAQHSKTHARTLDTLLAITLWANFACADFTLLHELGVLAAILRRPCRSRIFHPLLLQSSPSGKGQMTCGNIIFGVGCHCHLTVAVLDCKPEHVCLPSEGSCPAGFAKHSVQCYTNPLSAL